MFAASARSILTGCLVCAGTLGALGTSSAAAGGAPGPAPAARADGWVGPLTIGGSPGTYPGFDLAVAADGAMTMAYVEGGDVVLVQRPAGGGAWEAPVPLTVDGTANAVAAAYDGTGRLVVAWADAPTKARLVTRRQLPDGSWSAREVVATRSRDRFWELDLEVNARGDAVLGAVWLGPRSSPLLVVRRPAGGAWSRPSRFDAERYDLALGDRGPVAITWTTWESGRSEVLAARCPWSAGWGSTHVFARLRSPVLPLGASTASVDDEGTTVITWRDRAGDGSWEVRVARARRGHGFGAEVVVGRRAGNIDLAYSPPGVFTNARGDTVLLWMRDNGRLLAVRRPAGGRWSTPVTVKTSRGLMPWSAALDPSGAAVAVWSRGGWFGDPGRGPDAAVMSSDGTWSAPTVLSPWKEGVLDPQVAMNGGVAVAAWMAVAEDPDTHYRASTYAGS